MSESDRVKGLWPTNGQKLLLRAALLKGQDAIDAWENWVASMAVETIDTGSYRLLPLLFHNLNSLGIDHPLLKQLKGLHRFQWYKNQILLKHAGGLLLSFEKAGIKSLVLKGVALISLYYEDSGLRPMADFDVMVPVEQVPAAVRLLKEMNWKPLFAVPDHLIEERRVYTHAENYIHGMGFSIDLHWHLLTYRLEKDANEDFWNGAIPIRINGINTLSLNGTDMFLHVCAHGRLTAWHDFGSLRWVADALVILNKTPEIDWDRLVLQIEKRRLVLPMREALVYLRREFDAPVPEKVLETLSASPVTMSERVEYKIRSCPAVSRGPFLTLLMHCTNYSRLRRNVGFTKRMLGFPRYLQVMWRIDRLWQVPFYASFKLIQKVGRTPPCLVRHTSPADSLNMDSSPSSIFSTVSKKTTSAL